MTLPSKYTDPILRISLALAEYPILSDRIRDLMRQELFNRGAIHAQDFEALVREQAIRSQEREGLNDPFSEEPAETWELRQQRVRDHLTDFYFATNVPYEVFEVILKGALAKRKGKDEDISISFNPELAPKYVLFEQARAIERMPPKERVKYEARLQEIKVVLIRAMISDQLGYVRIAKKWLTVDDLFRIRKRKIGYGKIGGKAAGMLLATSILRAVAGEELNHCLTYPDSYFIGSDLMYTFMTLNGLMHWNDQKYKSEDEIRADYPAIRREYRAAEYPPDILARLQELVDRLRGKPLIVRSSSQLEDNFGTSFAGKYESYFCPNQGSPQNNLRAITQAIASIYASTLNPDALLYRRSKGLQDYDERMAILIQLVDGEPWGRYFLPHAAGVGFSRNLYRWSPNIRREDGFLRLVWGLGTRAVDRVGNDYPRLVALSHPTLRPEAAPQAIRRYSQQFVDLIDLEANAFKTLPVSEVLNPQYKVLRYLAQEYREGFLAPIRSNLMVSNPKHLVITFDDLLRRTSFPEKMRKLLNLLEDNYESPVDLEFTVKIQNSTSLNPEVCISILQCRPQSRVQDTTPVFPTDLPPEKILFSTRRMVPRGEIIGIEYVVFVPPEAYFALLSQAERVSVSRAIGRLNAALEGKTFICIGPGRWGTSNPELGVRVGYADIYHARALVELTGEDGGSAPEPSFGTHFFQDLMEANTFPLAIYLADADAVFDHAFFYETPNSLADFLPGEFLAAQPYLLAALRLIDVRACRPGERLDLVMDDDKGKAAAFLTPQQEAA